jgi:NAD(P)-dependent dehydrogenase (short-subunit alcohol dehydrogenase family)
LFYGLDLGSIDPDFSTYGDERMKAIRTWLITGCSSGFGRALAQAALEAGDRVLLTARDPAALEPLVAQYPERAAGERLDVTQPAQIAQVVAMAEQRFGAIDVLVNNAGYGVVGALEEIEPAEYRPMFEANFYGAMEMIRSVLPGMRRRRRGHIVNISSIAGLTCRAGYSFYGASKFALEGASEALAEEVAPLGIKVTLVEPGPFRTDFAGRSLQRAATRIDEYADTSGANIDAIAQRNGSQLGDPARAAQAILAAVNAERPPLRLPLSTYAYDRARTKLASLAAELDAWEAVGGKATEFP